jgi:hypothetical protein
MKEVKKEIDEKRRKRQERRDQMKEVKGKMRKKKEKRSFSLYNTNADFLLFTKRERR